jgi:IS1 family transposase
MQWFRGLVYKHKNFYQLYTRIEQQYKIKRLSTDNYASYKELIPWKKHRAGKQFTQQIENLNGNIRHYIKCKGYLKTIKMAENILKLYFN